MCSYVIVVTFMSAPLVVPIKIGRPSNILFIVIEMKLKRDTIIVYTVFHATFLCVTLCQCVCEGNQ